MAEFDIGMRGPVAVAKLNALWDRITEQLWSTSTSSLTIDVGAVTLTTQADKQYAVGQPVRITRTSDVTQWMDGQVTAYNSLTGTMSVQVATVSGSGTYSNWTIALSGQGGPAGDKGWSPLLAVIVDGARRVHQIVGWEGGEGTKPATGLYIGASGLVSDIAQAVDIRGGEGGVGPANVLTIGSVTSGPAAGATITGVSPTQELNLVLPKGDQGDKGDTGDTGAAGPANTLTVGTVTTGAAGSNVDVTITGTAPAQTINFTIPRGDKGAKGDTGDTGPAGVTPRGPWDAGAAYIANDLAEYNGSVYLRIVPGTTPTNPASDSVNWQVFVSRGTDGTGAVSSVNGHLPDGAGNVDLPNATSVAAGLLSGSDKSKLDGIASQATKNDTDANLKNRANHTGTQAISTVSGLQDALDDKADASSLATVATSGSYNDLSSKPAIPTIPGDATTSASGLMSAADKTKLNDIAAQATKNDTDANLKNRANHTGTQAISTVSGLQGALDAKAATGDIPTGATASEVLTGTDSTKFANASNLNSAVAFAALSGATVTPDLNAARNFTITLSANTTLANPTNLRPGQTGEIVVTQGGTVRTLSFGSYWKFAGGAPSVSTTANAVDVISYKVVNATLIIAALQKDFK